MTTQEQFQYRAIVHDIVDGKHGQYAVATSDEIDGVVTFSLTPDVWKEAVLPQRGIEVVLSDVVKKRAGWRALKAAFVRPANSNQQ